MFFEQIKQAPQGKDWRKRRQTTRMLHTLASRWSPKRSNYLLGHTMNKKQNLLRRGKNGEQSMVEVTP